MISLSTNLIYVLLLLGTIRTHWNKHLKPLTKLFVGFAIILLGFFFEQCSCFPLMK